MVYHLNTFKNVNVYSWSAVLSMQIYCNNLIPPSGSLVHLQMY